MSHTARKHPSSPELIPPRDDDASVIRERAEPESVRPRQDSAPVLREGEPQRSHSGTLAAPRSHSSTRPAVGSLDERLERKVRLATSLLKNVPPTDTRARLLNIALMRRDESLLDGVLAELNKPSPGT